MTGTGMSDHPAEPFSLRVAELLDESGQVSGHLWVETDWVQHSTGHLWWRRRLAPIPVFQFYESIGDHFTDRWLLQQFEVDAFSELVADLSSGSWRPSYDKAPEDVRYEVRWASADHEQGLALEIFGMDLRERRAMRRSRRARGLL
ncbi:hypothetical protein [Nocardioides sp. WS12]|uniref:hypothetical protein n=1 Tax=Nocardioides sp. WS12 TaxID=2486272 RepID=UPI0015F96627|nr:hypothetical protein [Nocardioides sp. WS12]